MVLMTLFRRLRRALAGDENEANLRFPLDTLLHLVSVTPGNDKLEPM